MSTNPPEKRTELRASDEDRERIADTLREALATGRLSHVELDERLSQVYAAKTLGELEPIAQDLPVVRPRTAVSVDDEKATALFSKVRRVGQWEVPRRLEAVARFGVVVLDFRYAEFPEGEVVLDANSAFGKVEIRIPENARIVGNGGTAVFGKRTLPVSPAADDTGPVIRIVGRSVFGHIRVNRGDRTWPGEE